MSNIKKGLAKILDGRFDKNISFRQLCGLLKKMGFQEKVKGSHHIFFRKDTELQNASLYASIMSLRATTLSWRGNLKSCKYERYYRLLRFARNDRVIVYDFAFCNSVEI